MVGSETLWALLASASNLRVGHPAEAANAQGLLPNATNGAWADTPAAQGPTPSPAEKMQMHLTWVVHWTQGGFFTGIYLIHTPLDLCACKCKCVTTTVLWMLLSD